MNPFGIPYYVLHSHTLILPYFHTHQTPVNNRHRLIIIISAGVFSQWSGGGVVTYYLHETLDQIGITSARDQNILNGCKAIWATIWALAAAVGVNRFGRRRLFLFSSIGMLCTYVTWTILAARNSITGQASLGFGVVVMIFMWYFFYAMAWLPLVTLYSVELLPVRFLSKARQDNLLAHYRG